MQAFVPGLVLFQSVLPGQPKPKDTGDMVFVAVEHELQYEPLHQDFGPLNLGCTIRFCGFLNRLLLEPSARVCVCLASDPRLKANAVCLLACWGVLFYGMTPETAMARFVGMQLPAFRDASSMASSSYALTILDCLDGMLRAVRCGYLHPMRFDVAAYRHYEQPEHGDLTWISPKFLAFAGPEDPALAYDNNSDALPPEHYMSYFQQHQITLVVRLNAPRYDASVFRKAGIQHLDLYFPDGSCPSDAVLQRFLHACELARGPVAVHCTAGLGRTGTCIAAYMMQHDAFSAKEAIGWLRLCRPGSVVGLQQHYLERLERHARDRLPVSVRPIGQQPHHYMVQSKAPTQQQTPVIQPLVYY